MNYQPTITYWPNLLDTQGGEWQAPDWETILRRLSAPRVYQGDMEHPGWSPVRFSPCERADENVQEIFALCLDYDKGTISVDQAADRFSSLYGLVATTRSHTPEVPRLRVTLPLNRPVTPTEYAELWKRCAHAYGPCDVSTRNPSRYWYLQGSKTGGEFRAVRLAGDETKMLDVDWWLAQSDPTIVERPVVRNQSAPTNVEKRALAYIATMPDAISGSGGHNVTWQVACALACGFDLDEETTYQILANNYNPRCSPPWKDKELRHKAKQARHNARLDRGYLLGDSGAWTPQTVQRHALPPREPGDDTDEIMASYGEDPQQEKPKPIHERFALFTERQLIKQVFDHVTSDMPKRGFTTGVSEIDELIGGLRPGMITCFGAQTSFGKSTAATMVFEANVPIGVKVLVITNEDQPLLYGRRVVCKRGNLNALAVRDGDLTAEQKEAIGALGRRAKDDYVLLNAAGMPAEDVAECILACRRELGTQLVILDYIQRVRMRAMMQDRRNEVSRAAELIGDAIKKHGPGTDLLVPAAGLVFSQLKRLGDKEPDLESFKETGDIENMAESIILGWRKIINVTAHGQENVQRMFNLPKNKDGLVDFVWKELEFDNRTASFTGRVLTDGMPTQINEFGDFQSGSWSPN